jgi:hypothetical protein
MGHHPTISSAALCGNFAPQVRRSKLDVHKVRLRFGFFLRHKIISQIALAESCGEALICYVLTYILALNCGFYNDYNV